MTMLLKAVDMKSSKQQQDKYGDGWYQERDRPRCRAVPHSRPERETLQGSQSSKPPGGPKAACSEDSNILSVHYFSVCLSACLSIHPSMFFFWLSEVFSSATTSLSFFPFQFFSRLLPLKVQNVLERPISELLSLLENTVLERLKARINYFDNGNADKQRPDLNWTVALSDASSIFTTLDFLLINI